MNRYVISNRQIALLMIRDSQDRGMRLEIDHKVLYTGFMP